MIDRLSPTLRPPRLPTHEQDWRRLLFLHWPVPVGVLRPLVPAALEIDLYDGRAYLGLIPFQITSLRPPLVPRWAGLRFLETNVRTYVHLDGRDPGVYFFSLDAASRLAVVGARLSLGLPYFHAQMRMRWQDGLVEYALRRPSGANPRLNVRYEVGEPLGPSPLGSLEHFLIERYLLHVERGSRLVSVQVHHAPYPVQRAQLLELHDELIAAVGLPEPAAPPPLVHYAAGIDVEIFAPRLTRS
jgi:uncharacterized protein